MKMWFWSRTSKCVFSTSTNSSPTVRVLLKFGERPVVSVSIIRRCILLLCWVGLYCFVVYKFLNSALDVVFYG